MSLYLDLYRVVLYWSAKPIKNRIKQTVLVFIEVCADTGLSAWLMGWLERTSGHIWLRPCSSSLTNHMPGLFLYAFHVQDADINSLVFVAERSMTYRGADIYVPCCSIMFWTSLRISLLDTCFILIRCPDWMALCEAPFVLKICQHTSVWEKSQNITNEEPYMNKKD